MVTGFEFLVHNCVDRHRFLCHYFSPDAKLYDYIKEEVGARMVDRIYDMTKEITNAAELGTTR